MENIRTHKELYKSIVLFVLECVDKDSSETAAQLYERWREMSGYTITDSSLMAFVLEYFENQKFCRRDAMIESAIVDHFYESNH